MSATPIITFQEALHKTQNERRHLLLGNGFSIALFRKIFTYSRLFDQADFSNLLEAQKVFGILCTTDFEEVIQGLRLSAQILPAFLDTHETTTNKMITQAEQIKELLVRTIAENHPTNPSEITEEQFSSCRKFLAYFISKDLHSSCRGIVYTANYDLLLYWTIMHDNESVEGRDKIILQTDDGFRAPEEEPDATHVTWGGLSDAQNIRYLHGGLHLFDDGYDLTKFCWERSGGIPLMQQIRSALEKNQFPLFISEGNSKDKLRKIRHSHVCLHSALKSLSKISGNLFIYGHSLADNDEHLIKHIVKSKIKRLFIGIYGGPNEISNQHIMRRAMNLATLSSKKKSKQQLEVIFFDSASAKVWDNIA